MSTLTVLLSNWYKAIFKSSVNLFGFFRLKNSCKLPLFNW